MTFFEVFEEDDEEVKDEINFYMPIRSRNMASIDGNNKVFSIDETLKKYGDLEAY